ncbi:NAD(P)-binding protein [Marasmius fiardii PR-910]|nr:NAD(P)-binding protein [Marasmius fiardii PR-910]
MNSQTVFVTGGSGFIGSHVVEELLSKNYHVRCAVRPSPKTDFFKSYYSSKFDETRFQVVEIPDITSSSAFEAKVFQDVYAIIHLASPPGHVTPEEIYTGAVDGTLNILKHAETAGVKRIIITGMVQTEKLTQHLTTREEVIQCKDPFIVYESCKLISQTAVWEWSVHHPHLDITYINIPLTYGPFTPSFHLPKPAFPGVNRFLYQLLVPNGSYPFTGQYVDVRDVAKVHVSSLKSPTALSIGKRKEIAFISPHVINFGYAVSLLSENRPMLKDRLIMGKAPLSKEDRLECEYETVDRVLGFRKDGFTDVEKTLLDTIDNYVKIESRWIEDGYTIEIPYY